MSEITKLYENAGIKSKAECTSKVCIVTNPHKDWCNKCESLKYEHPPFTAEKQIELIKILAKNIIQIDNTDGEYEFSIFDDAVSDFSSFEESLADLTNRMWQALTDAEKQQIKEILG